MTTLAVPRVVLHKERIQWFAAKYANAHDGRDKTMCGIVGFTGNRQAAPILLDGLSKLEYRGYDSAGLAVRDGENLAQVVKAKGRLSNLIEKTDGGKALKGTCGIGHTRWATHGEPSQTNAHPHVSGNCTRSGSGTVESEVVGVHNGIIENYTELKEKLLKHGCSVCAGRYSGYPGACGTRI